MYKYVECKCPRCGAIHKARFKHGYTGTLKVPYKFCGMCTKEIPFAYETDDMTLLLPKRNTVRECAT